MKNAIALVVGGPLVAAAINSDAVRDFVSALDAPTANHCVENSYDPNWSMMSFYNTCKQRITVKFCQKFAMLELNALLGGKQNEWKCSLGDVAPGGLVSSIKWVHERSSIASHMISASEYVFAACDAGWTPVWVEGSKYRCEKG